MGNWQHQGCRLSTVKVQVPQDVDQQKQSSCALCTMLHFILAVRTLARPARPRCRSSSRITSQLMAFSAGASAAAASYEVMTMSGLGTC